MKVYTRMLVLGLLTLCGSVLYGQNLQPQPIPIVDIHDSHFSDGYRTVTAYNEMKIRSLDPWGEPTEMTASDYLGFKAGEQIIMYPHSKLEAFGDGTVELIIEENNIDAAWFAPVENVGVVGKYEKLELGFNVEQYEDEIDNFKAGMGNTINPFDPEEIDCYMIFTRPDGTTKRVNAFYYDQYKPADDANWIEDPTDFPWRVRFAPDQVGVWSSKFYVKRNGIQIETKSIHFNCQGSDKKGYIQTNGRYLQYADSGEDFFAIGHNMYSASLGTSTPKKYGYYKDAFHELADVGGTFARIELGVQNALPYYRRQKDLNDVLPQHDNYFIKMDEMWAYDEVIDICHVREIYFTMFRHHVEIQLDDNYNYISWGDNPYNTAYNLQDRIKFFKNPDVLRWQNNCLRYIFARWGYTPSFAFYGHSEINGWAENTTTHCEELNEVIEGGIESTGYPELQFYQDILYSIDPLEHDCDNAEEINTKAVFYWFQCKKHFIENVLGKHRMMFTNSYADSPEQIEFEKRNVMFFTTDDMISFHNYSGMDRKDAQYKSRFEGYDAALNKNWANVSGHNKPVIMEETGLPIAGCQPSQQADGDCDVINFNQYERVMCCTDVDFHNTIWATSMMGGAGTAMDYFWPQIQGFGQVDNYSALASFFEGEELSSMDYTPKRWRDNSGDGKFNNVLWDTDVESYYLVSDNKERALGWVHNASHYWRNYTHLPCMQEIIAPGAVLSEVCERADYADVVTYPLEFDFSKLELMDKHTNNGADWYGQPIKIGGFKTSVFPISMKKYKIKFFNTRTGGDVLIHEDFSNVLGQLELEFPEMNLENPDYSYKIEFLGTENVIFSLSPEEIDDRFGEEGSEKRNFYMGVEKSENVLTKSVSIQPNPATDNVTVSSTFDIQKVTILNDLGKELTTLSNLRTKVIEIDISTFTAGVLMVIIETQEGTITHKVVKYN